MQKEKHEVVITKEDLMAMDYVVCNLSVPLIRDYRKIEKLIQKRINNKISLDEYEEQYKKIINESKSKFKCFNNNFKELYIINLINKKINNKSINLYEQVDFDNVLSGIINSLKFNVIPVNILNYIVNLDTNDLYNSIVNKVEIIPSDDIDIKNKQYIDFIENKINNQEKTIQKVYSKK